MKLPNVENAIVDIRKLRDYCLNDTHPTGKHKAIVFKSALGFTQENAEDLKKIILHSIQECDAMELEEDNFGKRFTVSIPWKSRNDSIVSIITGWVIKKDEDFPRLISCYIKERNKL